MAKKAKRTTSGSSIKLYAHFELSPRHQKAVTEFFKREHPELVNEYQEFLFAVYEENIVDWVQMTGIYVDEIVPKATKKAPKKKLRKRL